MNDNEIEEIDVRSFEHLTNLKELRLCNNKLLIEIDRKCFQPLKSIELIFLYENVSLDGLSCIKSSTKIWYDDEVKEKVKKYGFVSVWSKFLLQFPDLGNN